MIFYIINRLLQAIPVVFGVLTISFLLMNIVPGDPVRAMVGDYYNDETVESLREELGLNKPLHVQYINFIYNTFSGNLGKSFITNRPVMKDLKQKIPYTFQLAFASILFAIPIGLFLGITAAVNRGKIIDKILILISLIGISAPVFWIALLCILIVGIELQLLPPTGFGHIKFLILPAFVLGVRSMALFARTSRAYMLEVLNEDYIRTAKAKGLSSFKILYKHGLKNVLIPITTIIVTDFSSYLSGAVLTESIFGWPGIGRFALNAIVQRDFPVIQGTVLFITILIVLINIIIDIFYAWLDPRVRNTILDV